MKPPSKPILRLIAILLTVLVPLALLLTSVRLVLTPAFVALEYRTPGFPPDSYGMTQAQRLEYAPLALDYLLNNEGIDFLADQTFDDGSPLYNDRELSHMQDVKNLTQVLLKVWLADLGILALLGMWAWRAEWLVQFKAMLSQGGLVTLLAILALLVFAALSFNAFFTGFHRIFFEGDSWLFLFSDTLIRLFPLRFWRDVVLVIGALTLGGGAALWRGQRPR
jgi:integral membrane protein (TIGR01906 family)